MNKAGFAERRGKDTWRLVYSGGYGPDGRRLRHTRTIKASSSREAEKELAKFISEVETKQVVTTKKITFGEFAQRWMTEYAERRLAPKTIEDHREQLKGRILPKLGHLRIDQITPLHLMKYYNYMRSDNIRLDGKPGKLSEKTILKNHLLISSILQKAVMWQILPYNPARRVERPRPPKSRVKCFDEVQTRNIFEESKKEPLKYCVVIHLAFLCGLRLGEILGLEWKDIDFIKMTISIRRTSQYVTGSGIITKEPKTERSYRTLAISEMLIALLKNYKNERDEEIEKVGSLWNETDRLFTQWDGKPMHPSAITHWFQRFLKRAKVPVLNFHALRHTSATMMIVQGLHPKTISNRLGHASIQTTMDIYGHALESTDRDAAEKLEVMIPKKEE